MKTVVSCTRNTDFEGWRGASIETCCVFPSMFFCRGFCDDILGETPLETPPETHLETHPETHPEATQRPILSTYCQHICQHIIFSTILWNLTTFGTKISSKRTTFSLNFNVFDGPVAFVKTIVSCTRKTNFEGLEGHPGGNLLCIFMRCDLPRLSGQVCSRNFS